MGGHVEGGVHLNDDRPLLPLDVEHPEQGKSNRFECLALAQASLENHGERTLPAAREPQHERPARSALLLDRPFRDRLGAGHHRPLYLKFPGNDHSHLVQRSVAHVEDDSTLERRLPGRDAKDGLDLGADVRSERHDVQPEFERNARETVRLVHHGSKRALFEDLVGELRCSRRAIGADDAAHGPRLQLEQRTATDGHAPLVERCPVDRQCGNLDQRGLGRVARPGARCASVDGESITFASRFEQINREPLRAAVAGRRTPAAHVGADDSLGHLTRGDGHRERFPLAAREGEVESPDQLHTIFTDVHHRRRFRLQRHVDFAAADARSPLQMKLAIGRERGGNLLVGRPGFEDGAVFDAAQANLGLWIGDRDGQRRRRSRGQRGVGDPPSPRRSSGTRTSRIRTWRPLPSITTVSREVGAASGGATFPRSIGRSSSGTSCSRAGRPSRSAAASTAPPSRRGTSTGPST